MPKCVKSLGPSPMLVCVRMMDGWDGSLFTFSMQTKNDDWFYSVMWFLATVYIHSCVCMPVYGLTVYMCHCSCVEVMIVFPGMS